MRLIRPRLPVLGLLARSAVIPAVLMLTSNMVMVMFVPAVHMAVVGVAGAVAATSAIAMSIIAARRNEMGTPCGSAWRSRPSPRSS